MPYKTTELPVNFLSAERASLGWVDIHSPSLFDPPPRGT